MELRLIWREFPSIFDLKIQVCIEDWEASLASADQKLIVIHWKTKTVFLWCNISVQSLSFHSKSPAFDATYWTLCRWSRKILDFKFWSGWRSISLGLEKKLREGHWHHDIEVRTDWASRDFTIFVLLGRSHSYVSSFREENCIWETFETKAEIKTWSGLVQKREIVSRLKNDVKRTGSLRTLLKWEQSIKWLSTKHSVQSQQANRIRSWYQL